MSISNYAEVVLVDASLASNSILLPLANQIPYRMLTIKDVYGRSQLSTITIVTQTGEYFEDGITSTATINLNYGATTFYAGLSNRWMTLGGTVLSNAQIGNLSTMALRISSINGQLFTSFTGSTNSLSAGSIVVSSITTPYLSSLAIWVSSINGFAYSPGGGITTGNLLSTVEGLGSIGYISSPSLTSSFISTTAFVSLSFSSFSTALGPGGGVSSSNLQSTVEGLGSIGYISSLSLTSSFISTTVAFQTAGFLSSPNLFSTVEGLGSIGYISSLSLTSSLISTTVAFQTAGFLSSLNLLSTVEGLGSIGYISSASLTSSLISTTSFISLSFSSFSTAFGPGGGITGANLTSTVAGLGQIYVSSIPSTLSANQLLVSSVNVSSLIGITLSTQQIFTSSIVGNVSQFLSLSSQSLFVSSFYTATRQATPMFVTF